VIVVSDAARHVFMNLPDTPAVMPPVECEGLLSAVSELPSAQHFCRKPCKNKESEKLNWIYGSSFNSVPK
jgi:hypothetical protein